MFGGDQLTWVFAGAGATTRWSSAAWTSIRDDHQGAVTNSPANLEELEESGQLRLRPFRPAGVQMTFDAWRAAVARNLVRIARSMRGGKISRTLCRQAYDLELCGEFAERTVCHGCGLERTMLAASCNVRLCPFCEAVRSRAETEALVEKFEELRKDSIAVRNRRGELRSYTLSLVTFTARFDPEELEEFSGDSMRRRRAELLEVVDQAWKQVLSRDARGARLPGAAMRWSLEVPYGGAIHVHALVWRPMLDREDLAGLRAVYSAWGVDGNPDVAVVGRTKRRGRARALSRREIIREACKYLTKGSGPRRSSGVFAARETSTRMDPALAAIVVASFNRLHTSGSKGALRGVETRAEELEETVGEAKPCECGAVGLHERRWLHRSIVRFRDLDGVGRFRVKDWDRFDAPASNWRDALERRRARARDG